MNCGTRLIDAASGATIAVNPQYPAAPPTVVMPTQTPTVPTTTSPHGSAPVIKRSRRGWIIAAAVAAFAFILLIVIAGVAGVFIWNASRNAAEDLPPANKAVNSANTAANTASNTRPAWGLPDTMKDFVLSKDLDDTVRQIFPDTSESRGYLYRDSKTGATVELYISKYDSLSDAKTRYGKVPATLNLGAPVAKQAIEGGKGELGYYRKTSKTEPRLVIIAVAYVAIDPGGAVEVIMAPSEKECLRFVEAVGAYGTFVDNATSSKK